MRRLQAKIKDIIALEKEQGLRYISSKKRFNRSLWGDILNTGFRIVSEIVPNYYVKAMIKSIQASLMEKTTGKHFLTTHLDEKLRKINKQLNNLKNASTIQKMNNQLSNIGRKIFTYENQQMVLKHKVAVAAKQGSLAPWIGLD